MLQSSEVDGALQTLECALGTLASRYEDPFSDTDHENAFSREWLYWQHVLNDLVSVAVNQETSRVLPVDIRAWTYRYLFPVPRLWRASALHKPSWLTSSTYETQALSRLLHLRPIDHSILCEALQIADTVLLAPPTRPASWHTIQIPRASPTADAFGSAFLHAPALRDIGATIILHGSIADDTTTEFSDVDDVVIITPEAWHKPSKFQSVLSMLGESARRIQRFDPLQHHGHILLLPYDLAFLDQGIVPTSIFQSAVSLAQDCQLKMAVSPNLRGIGRTLFCLIRDLHKDCTRLHGNHLRLFDLKRLVSTISLLPALRQQITGVATDKKTAIEAAPHFLKANSMLALRWATAERAEWRLHLRQHSAWLLFCKSLPGLSRKQAEQYALATAPFVRPLQEDSDRILLSSVSLGLDCVQSLVTLVTKRNLAPSPSERAPPSQAIEGPCHE